MSEESETPASDVLDQILALNARAKTFLVENSHLYANPRILACAQRPNKQWLAIGELCIEGCTTYTIVVYDATKGAAYPVSPIDGIFSGKPQNSFREACSDFGYLSHYAEYAQDGTEIPLKLDSEVYLPRGEGAQPIAGALKGQTILRAGYE